MVGHYSAIAHPHNSVPILKPPFSENIQEGSEFFWVRKTLEPQEILTINLLQSRKMIHSLLNMNVADSYVPYQDLKNKQMICEILRQPARFFDSIRRSSYPLATNLILRFFLKSARSPPKSLLTAH
jgi:hypothetical protein